MSVSCMNFAYFVCKADEDFFRFCDLSLISSHFWFKLSKLEVSAWLERSTRPSELVHVCFRHELKSG